MTVARGIQVVGGSKKARATRSGLRAFVVSRTGKVASAAKATRLATAAARASHTSRKTIATRKANVAQALSVPNSVALALINRKHEGHSAVSVQTIKHCTRTAEPIVYVGAMD